MKRKFLVRLILALAACLLPLARGAEKPKLLLAIVIDQFRYDYLTRFRPDYHAGFQRLLDHGAVFTDANHIAFPTVTAIGHATFLSGATPSVSGIAGNDWYDRTAGKVVTSVSDDDVEEIGGTSGKRGASPRHLLVDTIPDELKMAGRSAKVIGVSLKDRAAILPAGHMANAAYWFDETSNHFVTSTYYAKALPPWAKAANDAGPIAKYAGAEWQALDAKPGDKPFCSMKNGTDVKFCASIEATPFGDEIIEEFAERAIDGEQLGRHEGTDVLAISFSSNDYVGHAAGPDSPEVRDISIRTDQTIGKLLNYLDAKIGSGATLVVLTADHGVAPVPEVNKARNMPGGRLDPHELAASIKKVLDDRFGSGDWLLPGSYGTYLNYSTIAEKKADAAEVRRVAAEAARTFPHIARVYTREQLEIGGDSSDPVGRAILLGYFGPRSGDLVIVTEPYFMFASKGTTHGSPYVYDTHVPVIFYGPGIRAGNYAERIAVNDIAPTLATYFGVQIPDGAFGRVLTEVLQ